MSDRKTFWIEYPRMSQTVSVIGVDSHESAVRYFRAELNRPEDMDSEDGHVLRVSEVVFGEKTDTREFAPVPTWEEKAAILSEDCNIALTCRITKGIASWFFVPDIWCEWRQPQTSGVLSMKNLGSPTPEIATKRAWQRSSQCGLHKLNDQTQRIERVEK